MITQPKDPSNTPRRDLLRWCGWFLAVHWLLLLLISTRYVTALDLPSAALGLAFAAAAFLGHMALLAYLPMAVLIPVVVVFPRRRVVIWLAVGLAAGCQILLLIDSQVSSPEIRANRTI